MAPESQTATADDKPKIWGRIRRVETGEVLDFTDAQVDGVGQRYMYVRGLDSKGCPACQRGDCVQLVVTKGNGRHTVLHDPWVLN